LGVEFKTLMMPGVLPTTTTTTYNYNYNDYATSNFNLQLQRNYLQPASLATTDPAATDHLSVGIVDNLPLQSRPASLATIQQQLQLHRCANAMTTTTSPPLHVRRQLYDDDNATPQLKEQTQALDYGATTVGKVIATAQGATAELWVRAAGDRWYRVLPPAHRSDDYLHGRNGATTELWVRAAGDPVVLRTPPCPSFRLLSSLTTWNSPQCRCGGGGTGELIISCFLLIILVAILLFLDLAGFHSRYTTRFSANWATPHGLSESSRAATYRVS
jgi:hypothetical protein